MTLKIVVANHPVSNVALSLRSFPPFISTRPLQEGRDNTFIFSVGSHGNETPSGARYIVRYSNLKFTRRDSQTL